MCQKKILNVNSKEEDSEKLTKVVVAEAFVWKLSRLVELICVDIWFVWVMEEVKIVAGFNVESGDVKEFEEVDDVLEVEMKL